MIKDLLEILMKFDLDKRKKLNCIEFVFDSNTIKINEDGMLIKARYFNDSRTVIIYPHLILDKEDLRKVVLHELSHHFGIREENIKY